MTKDWTLDKAPDQTGKVAIITGANSGIGYETALALAEKGATTILACRNTQKGEAAKKRILARHQNAKVKVSQIDTGSLKSVRSFAKKFLRDHTKLDLLINNAGIMMTPYSLSVDGIESQFAVNYVGHFFLTGLLLPFLNKTKGARVVNLGSTAYTYGGIQFEDINFTQNYDRKKSYGQSKTACIVFAYELQKRLEAAKHSTLSVVAHPGYSATNLGQNLPPLLKCLMVPIINTFYSQSAADGALNILYAALGKDIVGGVFIGPSGKGEAKGAPTKVTSPNWTHASALGKKLWTLSEKLTGIKYDF